jgi:predicted nucleic acid-binding protein
MEQEVPADASSLIYLAKADAFELAGGVARPIFVPPSVWQEAVVAGQQVGAPEVPRILVAEREGLLERVELAGSETHLAATIATQHRLGRGESEVLAITPPGGWAIVDEGRATRVARSRGITPVSTIFLAVVGHTAGDLDVNRASELLHRVAGAIGVRSDVLVALEQELRRRKT